MGQNSLVQKLKNQIHLGQSIYANIKYNFPSRKLKVLGVTGTDGKTTTTMMLYHILHESGIKVGYISTNGARIGKKDLDTGLHVTTPDPWMVPKYLNMMLDEGVEYVVLESTSSGLQQNRLWGIEFFGGIITNIKHDHLDYHENWENYAKAKFRLAQQIQKQGTLILNKDDKKSFDWLKPNTENLGIRIKTIEKSRVKDFRKSLKGMMFSVDGSEYSTNLIGDYNLENVLGVIALAEEIVAKDDIKKALKTFVPPQGRMELIQAEPFGVIIDFAHTPSSLESALKSVNEIRSDSQRLIVVFGCAGKRDKSRRKMGEVAAKFANIVILTAEDPRDEKLFDINSQIFEYSKPVGGELISRIKDSDAYKNTKYNVLESLLKASIEKNKIPFIAFDEDSVNSRKDAIDLALRIAKKNDIVFLTGKAHEQSLAFGAEEKEYPWSEHEVVRDLLNKQKSK